MAKSTVKELKADIMKARQGKMSYPTLNRKWKGKLDEGKWVHLCNKWETFSGKHQVSWGMKGPLRVGNNYKEFDRIEDAFKFAKKKAKDLGELTHFSSIMPNEKYDGVWVVLEGKLEKFV